MFPDALVQFVIDRFLSGLPKLTFEQQSIAFVHWCGRHCRLAHFNFSLKINCGFSSLKQYQLYCNRR
jgi:hypothetical protein